MMKRLVTIVFFLALFLVAAGLVAPGFINWNEHKDKVIARLEKYIDRKIDIGGDIKIQLVPQPQFMFADVKIFSNDEKKGLLIEIKSLEARLRMKDLLNGRLAIDGINLVEPRFNIESDSKGLLNIDNLLKQELSDVPLKTGIDFSAGAIELQKVTITEGSVRYLSQRTKADIKLEHINADVDANTLAGPFKVSGQFAFRDKLVNVTADMGFYNGERPASFSFLLQPVEGLPEVSFTGSIDFKSSVADGTLSIRQGTMASLMPQSFLSSMPFMYQIVDMESLVQITRDEWRMDKVKSKFGKGSISGKLGMGFSSQGQPLLSGNISAENIDLTADGVLPDVPQPFLANVKIKGKNIGYQGVRFERFDVEAESSNKSWDIKSAHLTLPGKTDVQLAGVITPGKKSSLMMGTVQSEDITGMIKSLSLNESHPLTFLQSAPFGKKLKASLAFDVLAEKKLLRDIQARFDDKTNITGGIDILPEAAVLNVTIDPYQLAGLTLSKVIVRGVLKRNEVQFQQLAGHAESGDFDLKGKVMIAEGKRDVTLEGKLFGGTAHISGSEATTGQESTYAADVDVKGQKASSVEGLLRLPLTGFLLPVGQDMDWSAKFSGGINLYKLDSLKIKSGTSVVSGAIEKKENGYSADLAADQIDFNSLIESEIAQNADIKLKAKKFLWRDIAIDNPVMVFRVSPNEIDISDLRGGLWGGMISTSSHAEKKNKTWSGTLTGDISEADLNIPKDLMEVQGLSFGKGNLRFDLASSGTNFLDLFKDMSGTLNVDAQNISISSFTPEKLMSSIEATSSFPTNFQGVVNDAVKNQGATVYAPFKAGLTFKNGKVFFENVSLASQSHEVNVSGQVDLPSYKYDLTGDIQLKKPGGIPALQIKRTDSDIKKSGDYAIDIRAVEDWMTRRFPPKQGTPRKGESKLEDQTPIQGILERLEVPPTTEQTPSINSEDLPVEQEILPDN